MSVSKNILKELEEIVPGFKWPENQADFEVPEGYFHRFPDSVLNKINGGSAEELPASLGRNMFEAPAGYFENLPQKVLSKIKNGDKEVSIVRLPRKHRNWQNWAAAAVIAAFVASAALIWFTPNHHTQNGQQAPFSLSQQLASVSDQAIEQYLGTHVNASNMNEVYNNLSDQDLQDVLTNGLSTSAIEEYLQNNTADSLSF